MANGRIAPIAARIVAVNAEVLRPQVEAIKKLDEAHARHLKSLGSLRPDASGLASARRYHAEAQQVRARS